MNLLGVQGISKSFRGLKAVSDAAFDVEQAHFDSPRRFASGGQMPCGRNMMTSSMTMP